MNAQHGAARKERCAALAARERQRAPWFSILPMSSGLRASHTHTHTHTHTHIHTHKRGVALAFSPVYTTVNRAYDQTRRNAGVYVAIC
jgi:hypothetical protein